MPAGNKNEILVGQDYHDPLDIAEPIYTQSTYEDGPVGLMLSFEFLSQFRLGRCIVRWIANMTGNGNVITYVVMPLEDFETHFKKKFTPIIEKK